MANKQLQFLVPAGADLDELQTRLKSVLGLSEVSSKTLDRTYYDSFDWRLYHKGDVLECITSGGESRLVRRPLNSTISSASEKIKGTPKFAQDLPAGLLREGLEKIFEMRAILPQVRLQTSIHLFSLLDDEEKTVLRLAVEENTLRGTDGGKSQPLGARILILPVKGYRKAEKQAVMTLSKEADLTVAEDDLLLVALAAESRQPGSYTSSLNLHLEPDMRANAATRDILLRLLEVIKDNEEGTRENIDSEFLHDFRVAIRKTRSALGQIKGVFPQRVVDKYSAGFAWLGSATGPTRDMDVYLLNFDNYRSSLPKSIQANLDPLHDFLIAHQKKEQAALAKVMKSARYRSLIDSWLATLQSALPEQSILPNAMRPVIEVADKRIFKVYQRVMREGLEIGPDSHAELLHDLRKTCKKLRYLMEFFQNLYPSAKINVLIGVLKSLQSNLGDFQDYEVQAETLKIFSRQMVEEGNAPAETLKAMAVLVEGLEARQDRTREEFDKRFANFAKQENQDRFEKLFRSRRVKKGAKN